MKKRFVNHRCGICGRTQPYFNGDIFNRPKCCGQVMILVKNNGDEVK